MNDGANSDARTTARADLAGTFVALADTLVDDFDVTDLYDRLTSACVDLLGAADAGVLLTDHHRVLQLVAQSGERMRRLERVELEHAAGPCLDCFISSSAVRADLRSSESAERWPAFTAEALRSGACAVLALPLRLRGETIGALCLVHDDDDAGPGRADTALAQAFADVATIALLQRRALDTSEMLAEQLQDALNGRIIIEQVKGVLAERGNLDVDAAFDLLRGYCRSNRVPLTATARDVVLGRLDPDDVLATRWPMSPPN